MRGTQTKNDRQERAAQRRRAADGGFLSRITAPVRHLIEFLREVRIEMQRVVWPSSEDTYTYTLVVVVAVVVVAAWVGLWDTIFTQLIAALRLYK